MYEPIKAACVGPTLSHEHVVDVQSGLEAAPVISFVEQFVDRM